MPNFITKFFLKLLNKMKILNDKLSKDLLNNIGLKVDLGCGTSPKEGFYSFDHLELDGIDVVADLNKPLSLLPDNCVEHLYSRHAFEHVENFLLLMSEIHRICKPNAKIEIIVPHFSNVYGFSDPTHVRFFALYSMYYFVSQENQPRIRRVPSFYSDKMFKVNSIKIDFYKNSSYLDKLFSGFFYKVVNINIHTQDFYERRLSSLFHAWQIRFILEPEK